MYIRKIILASVLMVIALSANAQKLAVKNNLLYDVTTSLNLGVELKVGDRTTLLLPASYNPWEFSDNRKFKHIMVQPEFRWWTCEPFSGHFFGVHGHWAFYNISGVGLTTTMRERRYEGWLAGAGVSYGYSWILGPRWSFEATIGVGYAYMDYDKYPYRKCEPIMESTTKHYFGPTKVGLTLVFMIK